MHKEQLVEICKKMYFGQKVDVEYQESPKSIRDASLVFRRYEETNDGKCVVWLSSDTVRERYDSTIKIPHGHLPQMDNIEIITFVPREYIINSTFRRNGIRKNTMEVPSERSTTPKRVSTYREPVLA